MKKIILAFAILTTALSASALSPDVVKRFTILDNPTTSTDQLFYKDDIGKNYVEAKMYLDAKSWVEEQGWTSAHTDFCFENAGSTFETNMCASSQVTFVQGLLATKFQELKKAIRNSAFLTASLDAVEAVKFAQNAAIAQGQIVADLCEADSLGWWGGTGRSAIWLGCQSSYLSDVKDLEILLALANYKQVTLAPGEEVWDHMNESAYVIEGARQKIRDAANLNDDSVERYLMDADKILNEEYNLTRKYYKDTYSDPEIYTNAEGQVLSVYALDTLKKFENSWIKYRDAFCQAYSVFMFPDSADQTKYGAVARAQCLENQTYKQTGVLRAIDRE